MVRFLNSGVSAMSRRSVANALKRRISNNVRYILAFQRFESCENTVNREDPLHSNSPPLREIENDISVLINGISFSFKKWRKLGYVTGFITYISIDAPDE